MDSKTKGDNQMNKITRKLNKLNKAKKPLGRVMYYLSQRYFFSVSVFFMILWILLVGKIIDGYFIDNWVIFSELFTFPALSIYFVHLEYKLDKWSYDAYLKHCEEEVERLEGLKKKV